jgi:hypothetical protein
VAITTWNRLEPDVVHDDPLRGVDDSLAARLADPLWMLARQWQMGEHRGEDGGSLVMARVAVASYPATELRIGERVHPVSADVPLEALVEPAPMPLDLSLRIAGGELLVALLERHGVSHLIPAACARFTWPIATGPMAALERLAAARFPDGLQVAASVGADQLAQDLAVAGPDSAAMASVTTEWRTWYEARTRPPVADAWSRDHLEHGFSLSADVAEGRITLEAAEYPGGQLDWDAFDVAGVNAGAGEPARRIDAEMQPLALDVPGMPVVRYWELEDPRFDAGRVSLGPGDLAAALLVEVALSFASDWFLLPVIVPVGALHQIEELVATDTFGIAHRIRPAAHVRPSAAWRLWANGRTRPELPAVDYLFTPSVVADTVSAAPIEEVSFHRDELANMVWAIERIVPDGLGRGTIVERRREPTPVPISIADLAYVPLPRLPSDRVPMVRISTGQATVFRRATAVDPAMEIGSVAGTLLTGDFSMREEELGHDGLLVTRQWQMALDAVGNRLIWCSRAKQPAPAQVSVRLAFDDLVVPQRRP